jgi:hypothetical protein
LAFHPYPQIIPQVFNPGGFGPPHGLTRASTCPWVDHSASGLQHATQHALFGLAFATAPPPGLTSPHTITRRLILQKARHHTTHTPTKRGTDHALTACRHTVSGTISRPLTGVLFTFPSRYSSAIGHQGVFRLTRWSWQIHTRFHGPRATRERQQWRRQGFTYRALTDYGQPSQAVRLPQTLYHSTPERRSGNDNAPQPHTRNARRLSTRAWFSLIPFRSPLLRESQLFSLPTGTEMFHFPALPPTALYIQTAATPHNRCWVTPFGNPRINARLPTPRGISQAPTSFIGSWYQGIHRVP